MIRTPQLGNEPGTSQLSFECSTNWASWKSVSFLSKLSHYPVTLCDVFVHLTIRRWLTTFSTRLHLEYIYKCSSRLLEFDLVKKWQYMSLTLLCLEKKIRTPQLGNEPRTSQLCFQCSTNWATWESMSFLSLFSHYPVTLCDVFVDLTIKRWLTTFSTRVHLEHMYKCSSRLLECDLVKNRCLWQLHGNRKMIRTPQLGNEPRTSQLSFECSTNWATGESMSILSMLSHYAVTFCDLFVHLTIRRWLTTFSTRVHLEHMYKCSSRLLECDLVKKWQ